MLAETKEMGVGTGFGKRQLSTARGRNGGRASLALVAGTVDFVFLEGPAEGGACSSCGRLADTVFGPDVEGMSERFGIGTVVRATDGRVVRSAAGS